MVNVLAFGSTNIFYDSRESNNQNHDLIGFDKTITTNPRLGPRDSVYGVLPRQISKWTIRMRFVIAALCIYITWRMLCHLFLFYLFCLVSWLTLVLVWSFLPIIYNNRKQKKIQNQTDNQPGTKLFCLCSLMVGFDNWSIGSFKWILFHTELNLMMLTELYQSFFLRLFHWPVPFRSSQTFFFTFLDSLVISEWKHRNDPSLLYLYHTTEWH